MMRWLLRAALVFGLALHAPARAQAPTQAPATPEPEQAAHQATTRKLNAYVGLLNRTLRAQESLARYASWVDMKAGPTGRERIIYGLYSLYDVRKEIETARAATVAAPVIPDLDAAVAAYIAAYEALAPAITKAEGYYERQDYKADKMAEGRALHAALAPGGQAFLAERAKVEALFAREKARSDADELALLERREGRKARWHLAHVMIRAREVVDHLPREAKPVVDLAAFDAALAAYAASVKDMDEYGAANPNAFSSFEGRPRSFLGRLREFRDKLARAKGDARRGPGSDLTWIVNDYNTMISIARTATQLSR